MAAETTPVEPANEAASSRKYCPICYSVMVRSEWEGLTGWRCTDPDCDFFIADPI